MTQTFDIAIVGTGIAGASLAAAIGPRASVLLIEAEDAPGYHATGRSAAFWSETYGGPGVQPLTTASGPFLRDGGFLETLGSLHIGRAADEAAIDAFLAEFDGSGIPLERVDPAKLVPGLQLDWSLGVFEPSSAYIDVAALQAAYLARARYSNWVARWSLRHAKVPVGRSRRVTPATAQASSSTLPAPGPMRSRRLQGSARSASSLIAVPSSRC